MRSVMGFKMETNQSTIIEVEAIRAVVFSTLPEQGLQTMTEDGVEFVMCPSALTAQM